MSMQDHGRSVPVRRVRVIPTLLVDGRERLVKSLKFSKRAYIGDPINAVKIFNTKEVDELVLFDIDASREGRAPNYGLIEDIVSEAFMPVAYGGGIASINHVARLYGCGIEKVILSSCLIDNPYLVSQVADRYGSQATVVCLPVKKSLFGRYRVVTHSGWRDSGLAPEVLARRLVKDGAGEVIVYSIDRDGTYAGYDLELLKRVASTVEVPVVACGGARGIEDFRAAIANAGCSAVAAGSLFVYQSKGRGVLITYPAQGTLSSELFEKVN